MIGPVFALVVAPAAPLARRLACGESVLLRAADRVQVHGEMRRAALRLPARAALDPAAVSSTGSCE